MSTNYRLEVLSFDEAFVEGDCHLPTYLKADRLFTDLKLWASPKFESSRVPPPPENYRPWPSEYSVALEGAIFMIFFSALETFQQGSVDVAELLLLLPILLIM